MNVNAGTICGTFGRPGVFSSEPPLHVMQDLGGWSDIRMVRWYAHLSADHLTVYADRLSELQVIRFNTTLIAIRECLVSPLMRHPGFWSACRVCTDSGHAQASTSAASNS